MGEQQFPQLVRIPEASVLGAESLDRQVHAARDVAGASGAFGCAGGPEAVAVVLGLRAHVEHHLAGLPDHREHCVPGRGEPWIADEA